MLLIQKLLLQAVRRLATNEKAQKLAADTYRDTIKPRADAAWENAKPRIEKTRDDIGAIAKETNPRKEPARFAGRATRRILDELRGEIPHKKK
jgi:hypothetical protein